MGSTSNSLERASALLIRLTGAMLGLFLLASAPVSAVGMEPTLSTLHHLRLAQERPGCAPPARLPIAPNDPGAHLGGTGTNCRDGRTSALELWLPEDRYLWLEPSGPNPAVWVDAGPVAAEAAPGKAPLGLRLSASAGGFKLETRQHGTATLTLIEPGRWQPITGPDGHRFWVFLTRRESHRSDAPGSVRRAN